jgi:hypothetical protein
LPKSLSGKGLRGRRAARARIGGEKSAQKGACLSPWRIMTYAQNVSHNRTFVDRR